MSEPSVSIIKATLKRWGLSVAVPFAVAVVVLATVPLGLWNAADRAWADTLLQLRVKLAPLPLNPQIFPVDLNDRAERALGAALDSRQAFADLFTLYGYGKLAVGMDFLFSGAADPQGDQAMVAAAAQMDGLVLAVVPVDAGLSEFTGKEYSAEESEILRSHLWHPQVVNAWRIPVAETFLLPNLPLAKASRFLGHIGVRPDSDGLYRKIALFYRWEDGYLPSLSLAMAAFHLGIDPSLVVIDAGNSVELVGKDVRVSIPVDDEGYAWIPYPTTWKEGWRRIPMEKVVQAVGDTDAEDEVLNLLGDVVTADLTTSHKDFGPTPIEAVYPLSGLHTSLLNGILNQRFYRSPSGWEIVELVVLVLWGVLLATSQRRSGALHLAMGVLVFVVLAWSLVSWWVFLVVPWFAGPMAAVLLAWLAAQILRLIRTHEERTLMVSALTRYFPASLAARVLDEKKVDLKPADKDLTLLFSDISGFTKWSSDKDAELVHGFLGDYLESMATILFEHGGTVDKFMGDGILAFFGDPFAQPDHAERAIRAALAMQVKVAELQKEWGEKAGLDLKVRIGINTGRVIVGNLGSKTRIEYTVIGSAVNLAQRMESNAPLGGILVTGETWQRVAGKFNFTPKEVKVKGYDEGIQAWVVEGKA